MSFIFVCLCVCASGYVTIKHDGDGVQRLLSSEKLRKRKLAGVTVTGVD